MLPGPSSLLASRSQLPGPWIVAQVAPHRSGHAKGVGFLVLGGDGLDRLDDQGLAFRLRHALEGARTDRREDLGVEDSRDGRGIDAEDIAAPGERHGDRGVELAEEPAAGGGSLRRLRTRGARPPAPAGAGGAVQRWDGVVCLDQARVPQREHQQAHEQRAHTAIRPGDPARELGRHDLGESSELGRATGEPSAAHYLPLAMSRLQTPVQPGMLDQLVNPTP
jgi:hypothetical protein